MSAFITRSTFAGRRAVVPRALAGLAVPLPLALAVPAAAAATFAVTGVIPVGQASPCRSIRLITGA